MTPQKPRRKTLEEIGAEKRKVGTMTDYQSNKRYWALAWRWWLTYGGHEVEAGKCLSRAIHCRNKARAS